MIEHILKLQSKRWCLNWTRSFTFFTFLSNNVSKGNSKFKPRTSSASASNMAVGLLIRLLCLCADYCQFPASNRPLNPHHHQICCMPPSLGGSWIPWTEPSAYYYCWEQYPANYVLSPWSHCLMILFSKFIFLSMTLYISSMLLQVR